MLHQWNTCALPHAHRQKRRRQKGKHTHMQNRSTPSCHQASVCVLGPSTHGHGFGSLGVDSHNCFQTKEKTWERARQETNRMGYAMITMTTYPPHGDKPSVEACGPVQVSADDEFHVGATRAREQHRRDAGTDRSTVTAKHFAWNRECCRHPALHRARQVVRRNRLTCGSRSQQNWGAPSRGSATNPGIFFGKARYRRKNGQNRKPTGTHSHHSRSLQGARCNSQEKMAS